MLTKIMHRIINKLRKPNIYKGTTCVNILETFPAFIANGWGLYKDRAELTIKSINQLIPGLVLLASQYSEDELYVEDISNFAGSHVNSEKATQLKSLFDGYGSDKATTHDYYLVYSKLLGDSESVTKVFEIGLGTNNIDIVSTMGKDGRPGASLRAFRDYCNNAEVYGVDFDKRVLFEEERIKTFFVDQTNLETFNDIDVVGKEFDLMIDDGLHAPNANIHSLAFFLPRIKVGGWAVIEDISPSSTDIWKLVAHMLPSNYKSRLIKSRVSFMFLVQKLS